MSNLEEAEKRIVELCERAEAKGWEFSAAQYLLRQCGCALEACASELGFVIGSGLDARHNWTRAASFLGIEDRASFGFAFDRVADRQPFVPRTPEAQLGAKLARRFVHKEGVSK